MIDYLQNLFITWGLSESLALYLGWVAVIIGIILGAVIANVIAKQILLNVINRLIRKTRITWDDYLIEHKVFTRLSHIAPALVIYFAAAGFPPAWQDYLQRFSTVYIIIAGILVLSAFLSAVVDAYQRLETSKQRPIKGYVQVAKLIIFIFVAIYAVGILLDKSVMPILTGLGAMTAVILLVFKDSILGLVASIQISSYDMVRLGDWIEMPKYGADGDVIDITLNTVKVQNWDKTISTIPAYALVSDSFKNWRGMSESGGRRIKRAIYIDMNTVKFAAEDMLARWERIHILKDYINRKKEELTVYNKEQNIDESVLVNGRRMTNIGTFRAYLVAYLNNHPKIHQNMTFLIRHLHPTEKGLPIEIYVFSNDQIWANYEAIQADIFDHILAVIPEFDLKVFQSPSGADIQKLSAKMSG